MPKVLFCAWEKARGKFRSGDDDVVEQRSAKFIEGGLAVVDGCVLRLVQRHQPDLILYVVRIG